MKKIKIEKNLGQVFYYVIPTLLSNVCIFLFSIVDGIFVGNGVGVEGLGAVNIVYPVIMVAFAGYYITTIGGCTVTAIRLGRGNIKGANDMFMHSFIFTVILSIIFTLSTIFFSDQICTLLKANETYFLYARDYLFWYGLFFIPLGLSFNLQGFCRNDGSPGIVTLAVALSTAINIILDWVYIFPLHMGTKGAAIATGISQYVSLFIVLFHFILKKGNLRFSKFKVDKELVKKIVIRGLPESIAQLTTPIMTCCMNLMLIMKIGDIGVNVFSLISYVSSFTFAVFCGTSEGLQPLFGFSYGEKNEKDLKYYYGAGLAINIIGSIIVLLPIIVFCEPICRIFGANDDVVYETIKVMPKFVWGFVFMSVNVLVSAYLYSTKRSSYAIVINVLRSCVIDVLIIMFLPNIFGMGIIWHTFGIYELVMVFISFILLNYSERNGIYFH